MTTPAERALDLADEYRRAKDNRQHWAQPGMAPDGREPEVIAAEYGDALRALLRGEG